jgi:hypothetical protein
VSRAGRTNNTSPFYGGGKINVSVPQGLNLCTTGFYISSSSNGTVMVIAGHCSEGLNSRAVWNGNNSAQIGNTEGVRFPDPDLGLIDGSSFDDRSFAWNDQTTHKDISGALEPTTGVAYCQFGAVSLRRCYSYIALDVAYEDVYGVTNHLALAAQPSGPGQSLGTGGDSGGGVFREVTTTISVRALVVARGCDATTCFALDHKLNTILATYQAYTVLN